MTQEENDIFKALQWHEKGFYFYIVPTSVRRSGMCKVSVKKYNKLKTAYESLKNNTK